MQRGALVIVALLSFGCSEGDPRSVNPNPTLVQAALSSRFDATEVRAEEAWTFHAPGALIFDLVQPAAAHYIDIEAYRRKSDLDRSPGKSYVDGPDVNGRGSLSDHQISGSGTALMLDDRTPNVWIDLFYRLGPNCQAPGCEDQIQIARETAVDFEACDRPHYVRARYRARFADGTVATGTFLTPQNPD